MKFDCVQETNEGDDFGAMSGDESYEDWATSLFVVRAAFVLSNMNAVFFLVMQKGTWKQDNAISKIRRKGYYNILVGFGKNTLLVLSLTNTKLYIKTWPGLSGTLVSYMMINSAHRLRHTLQ